jgi:hypothetical protein
MKLSAHNNDAFHCLSSKNGNVELLLKVNKKYRLDWVIHCTPPSMLQPNALCTFRIIRQWADLFYFEFINLTVGYKERKGETPAIRGNGTPTGATSCHGYIAYGLQLHNK